MKRLLKRTALLAAVLLGCAAANAETINGAGASFPAPVYAAWTYSYNKVNEAKDQFNYQSIGSGAGVSQLKSGTIDFAGSDDPVKEKDLRQHNLLQFPMLVGGIVPVVNIPGIKSDELKLDGATLAAIFLGDIRKWNDPAIASQNPGLKLPNQRITVVRRSDGSGTTWIFTNYLCKVSEKWAKGPGNAKDVKWFRGTLGAKGNPGIANNVSKTRGSIGYVEYAYAKEAKLATVQLKNADGNYVSPTSATFAAATANADWKGAKDFRVELNNQKGSNAWPITGVTYIVLKKDLNKATAEKLFGYFNWCYRDGRRQASDMHYVPMPEDVVKLVRESWKAVK